MVLSLKFVYKSQKLTSKSLRIQDPKNSTEDGTLNFCYPVLSEKISPKHAEHHMGVLNLSKHDSLIHELNLDQYLVENFLRWGSLLK